ncbi:hypothetical protein EVAR_40214_1 [Eumeta japonica]|uniref:Uncharacterized protein n=1 Tax=Eumeta variegata TaxID=151549 RepID=A0A4C1X9V7_EUMVA|nr:hypothetical protein EVAR_40214_1 [Eumeta japonica]
MSASSISYEIDEKREKRPSKSFQTEVTIDKTATTERRQTSTPEDLSRSEIKGCLISFGRNQNNQLSSIISVDDQRLRLWRSHSSANQTDPLITFVADGVHNT